MTVKKHYAVALTYKTIIGPGQMKKSLLVHSVYNAQNEDEAVGYAIRKAQEGGQSGALDQVIALEIFKEKTMVRKRKKTNEHV